MFCTNADRDDVLRDGRQRLAASMSWKTSRTAERWNAHEEQHDRDGDDQDDDRLGHGRDDLVLHCSAPFPGIGETVEHEFEHTTEFARLHMLM